MKGRVSSVFLLVLCMATVIAGSPRAPKSSIKYWRGRELETADLDGVELRNFKTSRYYFDNLPPFIYNMCALYYVMPDCLDELFGEDFDIASLIQEVCPSS